MSVECATEAASSGGEFGWQTSETGECGRRAGGEFGRRVWALSPGGEDPRSTEWRRDVRVASVGDKSGWRRPRFVDHGELSTGGE